MTAELKCMPQMRLQGQAGEIGPAVEAVRRFALAEGLAAAAADALAVAVDEAISNILRHAYDNPAETTVTIAVTASPREIEVVLVDAGRPFSPLDWSSPKLDGGPADRPVGGLGIHLMRRLVDRLDYRRDGETNRLVLCKLRAMLLAGKGAGREDGSDGIGA